MLSGARTAQPGGRAGPAGNSDHSSRRYVATARGSWLCSEHGHPDGVGRPSGGARHVRRFGALAAHHGGAQGGHGARIIGRSVVAVCIARAAPICHGVSRRHVAHGLGECGDVATDTLGRRRCRVPCWAGGGFVDGVARYAKCAGGAAIASGAAIAEYARSASEQ